MWKNCYSVFIKQCSHSNWNVHSWEEFVHYGCSFVNQKLQVSDTSAIQQLADFSRAVQSCHLPKSKEMQLIKGFCRVWIQTVNCSADPGNMKLSLCIVRTVHSKRFIVTYKHLSDYDCLYMLLLYLHLVKMNSK